MSYNGMLELKWLKPRADKTEKRASGDTNEDRRQRLGFDPIRVCVFQNILVKEAQVLHGRFALPDCEREMNELAFEFDKALPARVDSSMSHESAMQLRKRLSDVAGNFLKGRVAGLDPVFPDLITDAVLDFFHLPRRKLAA